MLTFVGRRQPNLAPDLNRPELGTSSIEVGQNWGRVDQSWAILTGVGPIINQCAPVSTDYASSWPKSERLRPSQNDMRWSGRADDGAFATSVYKNAAHTIRAKHRR